MAKSGVDRTVVSPPAGTGNVSGLGQAFSLDLNSGQGNYSVAFETPEGVAGLKPVVKLEYSHSSANGPFGMGWVLPLRQINRRLDFGVEEGVKEHFLEAGTELGIGADGIFRAAREMNFSRYRRVGEHWEITEKNGGRFFLGLTEQGRVSDPDNPGRIQSWLLQQQQDVNGNTIEYDYQLIEGYPYLVAIRYARYAIRFAYQQRPDVAINGRAGFIRRITQRCNEISLWLVADNRKVRSMSVGYELSDHSALSLLSQVQLTGFSADGLADVVKNPQRFVYSQFNSKAINVDWMKSRRGDPVPPPLTDVDTALVSLDDLPLPGILANRNGRQYYWPCDGAGNWDLPRPLASTPIGSSFAAEGVQFLDVDADGHAEMLVGVGSNPLNGYYQNNGAEGWGDFVAYPRQARVFPPFETGRVRLTDLEGDGFVDAVYSTSRGLVNFYNRGKKGWADPTISTNVTDVDFSDPLVFLTDMTGDGLADVVRVRSGQVEYWPGIGSGKYGERQVMGSSPRLSGVSRSPEEILLLDVDGDGCSDMVRISASGIELYINQAGTGFASAIQYSSVPTPLPGTVRVVDIQGTGKPGLLYNSYRSGSVGYVAFQWGQDTPAYLLQQLDNGSGLRSEIEYKPIISMALSDRNDGKPWDTHLPFPLWVVSATREIDDVRDLHIECQYRYSQGHFDDRSRRFQGFAEVEKLELGDDSRTDVLTRYQFLMRQAEIPGNGPAQGNLDRMLSKIEVFSLDGSAEETLPYHTEENEYALLPLEPFLDGSERVFVSVSRSVKTYQERTADQRVEERQYQYDLLGNLSQEIVIGHGIENGLPVAEKRIVTEVLYASDNDNQIWQISQIIKRDQNGLILAEVRRYYDGVDFSGLALGDLTLGRKVREEYLVNTVAEFNDHYGVMDKAALGYFEQASADGNASVFAVESRITYTDEGNVATESTGTGRTTIKRYEPDGLFVHEEEVNGNIGTRTNDPVTGKPTQLSGASGATTRMSYDAFGRITHLLNADDTPANPTRRFSYDDTNVPHSMGVSYRVDANTRSQTVTYYDGAAKEVQRRVERGPNDVVVSGWIDQNPWRQSKAEYEPSLDVTLEYSKPDTAGLPTRQSLFDGEGRPFRTRNYNAAESHTEFTPFELRLHRPNQESPQRERVDVWNYRTSVTQAVEAGVELTTHFNVGLFGELLSLEDDTGEIANYRYDMRGNLLNVNHRDAGPRAQWLNSQNEIVRTVDANANDINVTRDGEGRIVRVVLNGDVVESFVYDDGDPTVDGRMLSASYPAGEQSYAFNDRGQMSRHRTGIGGNNFDLEYAYNDMGRQISVTYPDGTEVIRDYYLNGMVKSIEGIIDNIHYDAKNDPVEVVYANGVTTTIVYESGVGHIRSQKTVDGAGNMLEDARYSFNELMQIVKAVDDAPGVKRELDYEYDSLMQLAKMQGNDVDGNYTSDYSYSNGYNLTSVGESSWELHYDDADKPDRLNSIERPNQPLFATQHDANGNMLSVPGKQLLFNFKNQLESVDLDDGSRIQYDYDYRGNRIRRRVTRNGATTETIYLGRMVEIEGPVHTNYALLNGKRVALLRDGQTRWLHTDYRGSLIFITNEAATKLAHTSYLPFGNIRKQHGNAPLQTFALHDYDSETGLVYMGYRWFMPEAGRFISADPLYLYQPERSEGDPKKLRLYSYTGNDPLNQVDPTGLSFWSVAGAIVGVIVGIVIAVAVVAAFASGIGFGILAIVGVIGLMTVSYVVAANNQGNAWGEFFRGFMIGLNAGMSASFLAMMGPLGAVLGVAVGVIIFLSSIDSIASSEVYQGVLGWSNWVSPMSWLVVGLGLIMWILNGLGHLLLWELPNLWGGGIAFFRITGFKMDWSTGMLATRGGFIANLNPIDTAYNMGNFAYVDTNSTGWHLDHEAGHNLNLGAYGSIFHFIGFVHEMGTSAGSGAYSEVLAESNTGSGGMWT